MAGQLCFSCCTQDCPYLIREQNVLQRTGSYIPAFRTPSVINQQKSRRFESWFMKNSAQKEPFRFQIHSIRLLIATFLIAKRKSMNWTRAEPAFNLLALDRVYPSLAYRRKRSCLFYEEDLWGVFGNFGTWVGRIWGSSQPCSKPLGGKCGGRRDRYGCSCHSGAR